MTIEELEQRLTQIATRLERLEGSSILLATDQPQFVADVSASATTDQVRAGLIALLTALKTNRFIV